MRTSSISTWNCRFTGEHFLFAKYNAKTKKGLGLDHILWEFLKTKGKCEVGKLICRNELETELTIANCSKISNNHFERKKVT